MNPALTSKNQQTPDGQTRGGTGFAPGSSAREEFARGWPVLLAATLGVGIGISSLPYYTFGLFVREIELDLGWTRTQLASSQFAYLLCLAFASPFVGNIVDRHGVRGPLLVSLLALAGSFALLATVETLPAFVLLHGAMALLASASSPLGYTRVVNTWFAQARGLALGLTLTGTGIAAALTPMLLSAVISHDGWRAAYEALALVVLCATPLVLWRLRTAPSGRMAQASNATSKPDGAHFSTAVRQRTFWHLLAIFFVLPLAANGLVAHFVPMLSDAGMSLRESAAVASIIGIAVIVGRITMGALIDRYFAPRVAMLAVSLAGLGIVTLAVIGVEAAVVAAFALGFALGAEADLLSYLNVRYFGLAAYGRIYGTQYAAFMLGTGISPLWIAATFDITGTYDVALAASALLMAAVVVALLLLPRFPVESRNN